MADGPKNPEGASQSPDQIVRVNQGENKTAEVNLSDVNGLFSDIGVYNEQFSLGSTMSRLLIGNLEFEHDQQDNNPQTEKPLLGQEKDYQEMKSSALSIIHGNVLDQTGLSLEPVSGKKAVMFGPEGQLGEGEMRLNISNKDRFLSFLGALKPEQVENKALKPNLESLSGIFDQQLFDQYNLTEPSDDALRLLGGLGEIVNQYKRLGMEQSVTKLESYLNHARQGDLREYLLINQKGLFSEPGKAFGPADWQKDATPAYLEKRWDEALNTLNMAKENPKAEALYNQLKDHLKNCAQIAAGSISSLSGPSLENKTEFIRILGQVKGQLEQQNPQQPPTVD